VMTRKDDLPTVAPKLVLAEDIQRIIDWYFESRIQLRGNVLVKGASGFIGQWLYISLYQISKIDSNFKVFANTARPEILNEHWSWLSGSYELELIKQPEHFELIFDLSLPPTGETQSSQMNQSLGFYRNILECAFVSKIGSRIVHPSSGAVYGDLRYRGNLCEDNDHLPENLSIYGETKLNIEMMRTQFDDMSIDFLTPRIFSVFGPLMRKDSPLVGNIFLRTAGHGINIVGKSSRQVYRDFTYITDLLKQLILLGCYGSPIPNINLGSSNVYEIAEFGALIAEKSGVSFDSGEASIRLDKYYGCLHHLESLFHDEIGSFMSLSASIDRTLKFYKD
jgi:nucleoside-diphosphate-sugar epimerase